MQIQPCDRIPGCAPGSRERCVDVLEAQPARGELEFSSSEGRADEPRLLPGLEQAQTELPASLWLVLVGCPFAQLYVPALSFRSFMENHLWYGDGIIEWYKLFLGFIQCVDLFKLRIWLITSVLFITVISLHYYSYLFCIKIWNSLKGNLERQTLVTCNIFFLREIRYWCTHLTASTVLWGILCFSVRKRISIH